MPTKTIADLEADLNTSNGPIRRVRAVQGLNRYQHSARAMSLFEFALQDPLQMVWRRALEQLGSIGSPEALRLLRKALRHSDPLVRREAQSVLSGIKHRSAARA